MIVVSSTVRHSPSLSTTSRTSSSGAEALPVGGGIADVFRLGAGDIGETPFQRGDHIRRIVDRQGGLGEIGQLGPGGKIELRDIVHRFDQRHLPVFDLAHRADHFGVAFVTDEDDVPILFDLAFGLAVHLADQRAGGVDGLQLALGGLGVHGRADAVSGEDDRLTGRHLVELLDEDRAARLEVGHDVLVVDDLLADVDRGAVEVQRLLDGHHGAVDAGAVAARGSQQHGLVGLVGGQHRGHAHVGRHACHRTGVGALL